MKTISSAILKQPWSLIILTFCLVWTIGCQADQLPRRPIPVPESPAALQRGESSAPPINTAPRQATAPPLSPQPTNPSANQVAGLRWSIPVRWKLGRASSMRVATYWIPSTDPKTEGECSVFYFGANQGGSLTANFERWKQQFRPDPGKTQLASEIKQFQVRGMKVATLELQGTFMASIRPMDPQTIPKPNHEMFGVIVNAPQGMVFFKCVGPHVAMQNAKHEFHTLVQSFQPNTSP